MDTYAVSAQVTITTQNKTPSAMETVKDKLMRSVAPANVIPKPRTKVTVIGVGSVGMACAFSLMHIVGELALIDVMEDKVKGEVYDLQHGEQFLDRCTVSGGSDYKCSANSDIVVITAGARQKEGESRLNLVQRNVDIFKGIVPEIVKYSPNCIILVIANPCDILTYVTAKLSKFPTHRVLGSGTTLDSARFRHLLGKKLGVSANSVHGYVIGEHGDSSVPVWSSVTVAGVNLATLNPAIGTPTDPEKFADVHKEVVDSAYEIIRLKGYTSWAIGLTCKAICNAILNNLHCIYPVTTSAKGFYGITEDVYLSLPCLLTSNGVNCVLPQKLNQEEDTKIKDSASTLWEVIKGIQW